METFLKWLRRIGWSVTALLVLLIFVGFMDYGFMPMLVSRRAVLAVPEVEGIPLAQAERRLTELNLVPVVNQRKPSQTVPEGHVLAQTPPPHRQVKEQRRIYLIVSDGPRVIPVPFVSQGQSLRQALIALEERGLVVPEIEFRFSEEIPRNVVISQDPEAGGPIQVGEEVSLVVSEGAMPPPGVVPSLLGYNLRTVSYLGRRLGMGLWIAKREININRLPDTIIEQSVEPGTPITEGMRVEIVISKLPVADVDTLQTTGQE